MAILWHEAPTTLQVTSRSHYLFLVFPELLTVYTKKIFEITFLLSPYPVTEQTSQASIVEAK